MARREDIVNTIWDDLEHLSDDAFMLYVWSWTNPKCGMAGIYRIARHKMVEGRFDEDRLSAALAECEADGLLRYEDGVLWNVARVKRLSGISKNYAKSIVRDVREVEGNPLVAGFMARYGDHEKLVEEFAEQGLSKGSPTLGTHDRPMAKGSDEDGSTKPNSQPLPMGSGTHHGHGYGQGPGSSLPLTAEPELPTVYRYVVAAMERVSFARGVASASVAALAQVCQDFSARDLEQEVDEFAHYWTEGPGTKLPLSDVAWAWRKWLGRGGRKPSAARPGGRGTVADDLRDYEAEVERLRAEEAGV